MNGNNVRLLDLQFGIEGGFGRCDEYAASQTEIDAGTHRCYARELPAPRSAKNVMPAVCAHKWARIRSRSDMISRTVTRVAYYRVRALLSLPEYTRSAVGILRLSLARTITAFFGDRMFRAETNGSQALRATAGRVVQ